MIIGYKFLLQKRDKRVWTRLRGNGGMIGAGTLHVQDAHHSSLIADKLLRRAQRQLEREGCLYVHVETPTGPVTFTSFRVTPSSVVECRPVFM